MTLTPSICVVTGAGSGIGKAIAQRLALEGGKVVCVDLNEQAVAATVKGIQAASGIAEAVTADVSNPVAVDGFIARCVEFYD